MQPSTFANRFPIVFHISISLSNIPRQILMKYNSSSYHCYNLRIREGNRIGHFGCFQNNAIEFLLLKRHNT